MSQTRDQQCFTISEVAADWKLLKLAQRCESCHKKWSMFYGTQYTLQCTVLVIRLYYVMLTVSLIMLLLLLQRQVVLAWMLCSVHCMCCWRVQLCIETNIQRVTYLSLCYSQTNNNKVVLWLFHRQNCLLSCYGRCKIITSRQLLRRRRNTVIDSRSP